MKLFCDKLIHSALRRHHSRTMHKVLAISCMLVLTLAMQHIEIQNQKGKGWVWRGGIVPKNVIRRGPKAVDRFSVDALSSGPITIRSGSMITFTKLPKTHMLKVDNKAFNPKRCYQESASITIHKRGKKESTLEHLFNLRVEKPDVQTKPIQNEGFLVAKGRAKGQAKGLRLTSKFQAMKGQYAEYQKEVTVGAAVYVPFPVLRKIITGESGDAATLGLTRIQNNGCNFEVKQLPADTKINVQFDGREDDETHKDLGSLVFITSIDEDKVIFQISLGEKKVHVEMTSSEFSQLVKVEAKSYRSAVAAAINKTRSSGRKKKKRNVAKDEEDQLSELAAALLKRKQKIQKTVTGQTNENYDRIEQTAILREAKNGKCNVVPSAPSAMETEVEKWRSAIEEDTRLQFFWHSEDSNQQWRQTYEKSAAGANTPPQMYWYNPSTTTSQWEEPALVTAIKQSLAKRAASVAKRAASGPSPPGPPPIRN